MIQRNRDDSYFMTHTYGIIRSIVLAQVPNGLSIPSYCGYGIENGTTTGTGSEKVSLTKYWFDSF